MKNIRIGVVGGYRGTSMIHALKEIDFASIVAICDFNDEVLKNQKEYNKGLDIAYFKDFDEMLKYDIDAVVLANYANEHAPFAIKALKAGKHVFSEVLPCQTLSEAVELVETVEKTGLIYDYGENYCYMPAPMEMKKLYQKGELGDFEYGEGEYIHNCEPIWHDITYGIKDHWRNLMYSTFYCTHSIGPLIHIVKERPVSVVGFEGTRNERNLRVGAKGGQFAVEMITLENGGIIRSTHGFLYRNSIWYSVYGSKGVAESSREITESGVDTIHVNIDKYSGEYAERKPQCYKPKTDEISKEFGHGGSDFYTVFNFIKKIRGDDDADIIDVYEAMDMFLPGLMAYRSILKGGVSVPIPNLRNKEERDKWRNDTACVDPKVAGDMLLPTFSKGTPNISDEVYEKVKNKYLKAIKDGDKYMNGVYGKDK